MDFDEVFQASVRFGSTITTSVLLLALAISAKNMFARKWLIASMAIALIASTSFLTIALIAPSLQNSMSDLLHLYSWYDVLSLLSLFGTACLALFLFANWATTRMKLDVINLLFSFSGRIPRSAFWISLAILVPVGVSVGVQPVFTKAEGIALIFIWAVYFGWLVLSVWIGLAVYAKRWHDCSRSGWMTLVGLIPVIGTVGMLVYLGFVSGARGANEFGEDPLVV